MIDPHIRARRWVVCLLGIIAVCYAFFYGNGLYVGDDQAYLWILRDGYGWQPDLGPYRIGRWAALHWLRTNGRMANFMAPFVMGVLPPWFVGVMCGIMVSAMCAMICRLGGLWTDRHIRLGGCTVVFAIVVAVFPWWDSFTLVDVALNYIWSAAFGLLYIYIWQRGPDVKGWRRAILMIFGFVAGSMHEAMSAPLLVAFGLMFWMNREKVSRCRYMMIFAFAAGVAVCLLSPGILCRAMDHGLPDDPLPQLMVKSVPVTLALLVYIVICLCRGGRVRKNTVESLRGWAGFWTVAAVVSMLFCAIGGIVGRSGWFSQTYAIVAFALLRTAVSRRPTLSWRGDIGVAALMSVIVVTVCTGTAVWGIKAAREVAIASRMYAASADGVIFHDAVPDTCQPWWLNRRIHYMPDPDDGYAMAMMKKYYRKPQYVVLPAAARDLDFDSLERHMFDDGSYLCDRMPASACPDKRQPDILVTSGMDGEMVVLPFDFRLRRFYYVTPRILDYGDR